MSCLFCPKELFQLIALHVSCGVHRLALHLRAFLFVVCVLLLARPCGFVPLRAQESWWLFVCFSFFVVFVFLVADLVRILIRLLSLLPERVVLQLLSRAVAAARAAAAAQDDKAAT